MAIVSTKKIKCLDSGNLHMSDSVITIAATAFGVAVSLAVDAALSSMGIKTPYIAFVPTIVGTCALAGFGGALWAILFSSLAVWCFVLPDAGEGMLSYGDFGHLCVFIGVNMFVCWIIDGLRRQNAELSRDNVTLGCKISALLGRDQTP